MRQSRDAAPRVVVKPKLAESLLREQTGSEHAGDTEPPFGLVSADQRLTLLRFLAATPSGRFTQREVADGLCVSKVEARRRLQAAVAEGLVVASLEESPATPGRRLFSLSQPKGLEELERLERASG